GTGPRPGRGPSVMRRRFRLPGGTGNTAIAAVTVVALCSGLWLLQDGAAPPPPPPPPPPPAPPPPRRPRRRPPVPAPAPAASPAQARAADADRSGGPVSAPALPPSPPDRIRIPAIDVDAPLTGLGLTPTGSLDVPPAARKNLAGWYEAGTTPGERGTAIVAGHVDNAEGPAVFFSLGALRKGSTIEVDRRDGGVAVFTVDAVEVYDARDFPDAKVYGAAHRRELRVITCGGGSSRTTGYRGNVVVYAHLTGSR